MSKFFLVFFTCLSFNVLADQLEAPSPTPSPTPQPPSEDPVQSLSIFKNEKSTRDLRESNIYHVQGTWAPISMWVPSKLGVSAGYISDPAWTFEFEFLQGSIPLKIGKVDFGGITDRRYGLIARSFGQRNSFHFIYGLIRHEFKAELGSDLISRIPGTPSGRSISFQSWGPQLGIGNRWQFDIGLTFTVDWVSVYFPTMNKTSDLAAFDEVTNSNDRSNLDDAFSIIKNFWIFDFFKFNLGYSF